VRPSYGSVLLPLYAEDGLRLGELARRARLSKQTLTTMARAAELDGLITRETDPADARATLVFLTDRARELRPVAERALADLEAAVSTADREALLETLRQIADLGSQHEPAARSNTS
jgi:DNA-binding MarR family transcriptional regulator